MRNNILLACGSVGAFYVLSSLAMLLLLLPGFLSPTPQHGNARDQAYFRQVLVESQQAKAEGRTYRPPPAPWLHWVEDRYPAMIAGGCLAAFVAMLPWGFAVSERAASGDGQRLRWVALGAIALLTALPTAILSRVAAVWVTPCIALSGWVGSVAVPVIRRVRYPG